MALFGKKKEDSDMKQASKVKEATSKDSKPAENPVPAAPTPDLAAPAETGNIAPPGGVPDLTGNPANDSFNNPFSDTSGPSAQSSTDISAPLINDSDFSDMPGSPSATPAPGASGAPVVTTNTTMDVASSVEGTSREDIEEMVDEVVEKVIEERWKELVEKVDRVVSWKDKQEAHVNMIKEDVTTIKEAFDSLEKKLVSKLGSYDKNILDVNSEIKALEKVFSKVTPTLVNNVNELSKITKDLKGEKDSTDTNS